jgi:hypothetical protein
MGCKGVICLLFPSFVPLLPGGQCHNNRCNYGPVLLLYICSIPVSSRLTSFLLFAFAGLAPPAAAAVTILVATLCY